MADDGGVVGLYSQPSLRSSTLVFVSEESLFRATLAGDEAPLVASRLTRAHRGADRWPVLSPDGTRIAFVSTRDNVADVYAMSAAGGPARRLTWTAASTAARHLRVCGWSADGSRVLITSSHLSTYIGPQLAWVDADGRYELELLRISGASDGVLVPSPDAATLFFVQLPAKADHCLRYKGGYARRLWRVDLDASGAPTAEAVLLTAERDGESYAPALWRRGPRLAPRLLYLSDRSGLPNLYSMALDGADVRQHTSYDAWEVRGFTVDAAGAAGAAAHEARVVLQVPTAARG